MPNKYKNSLTLIVVLVILVTAFAMLPLPGGDDWGIYYGSAKRILNNTELYGKVVTFSYLYNPPWVPILFVPFSLLPFQWGWGLLSVSSLVIIVFLAKKFDLGLVKLSIVLLSPPVFYILLHGQIDALVLGALLLPFEWWPIAAITKPQVALGYFFGIPRSYWGRAAVYTTLILTLSFILFGNWPLEIIRQPQPSGAHNFWVGLWPFNLPVGVGLLFLGINRKDLRLMISASPFLMPYAATSSFLGVWIAMCSMLKKWQAAIILILYWTVVVYRAIG